MVVHTIVFVPPLSLGTRVVFDSWTQTPWLLARTKQDHYIFNSISNILIVLLYTIFYFLSGSITMVEYSSRNNLSHHHQGFGMEAHSIDGVSAQSDSKFYDDDGHVKRTGTLLMTLLILVMISIWYNIWWVGYYDYEIGTLWTTSSHIITAVVGSGVLSLAWAMAQMGWVVGPAVMIFFSVVTLYTTSLLADCYRCGDPVSGKRNYTFMDAVQTILGKKKIHI